MVLLFVAGKVVLTGKNIVTLFGFCRPTDGFVIGRAMHPELHVHVLSDEIGQETRIVNDMNELR